MPPIFPLLPVPNADTQAKRLLSNLIFTPVNKKGHIFSTQLKRTKRHNDLKQHSSKLLHQDTFSTGHFYYKNV